MSKTIKITNKQLEEAMDVFVNKMGTETPEQALKRTQKETEQEVGSGKQVNYVLSSDQIKECKTLTKEKILEMRRKFLQENSVKIKKTALFKKQ